MRVVEELPASAWDDFMVQTPGGTVFQSHGWSALRPLCGWDIRRLAIVGGAGEILAAAAVGRRALLRGAPAVLYAQRGPVMRPGEWDALDLLLDALRREARLRRAVFVKVNPDVPAAVPELALALRGHGYHPVAGGAYAHSVTRRVDLEPDWAAVKASFEGRTRRAIDKAIRDGVTVRSGIEPERSERFASLLAAAARRQGFAAVPRRFLAAVVAELGPRGQCRVFTAELEGEVLAGAVALAFGQRGTYMWGAMTQGARRHRVSASELLQWDMMQWARAQGCREYDLQGVPEHCSESDPGWGIHLFKRGFGGRIVKLLGEFDQVHAPVVYRAWNVLEPAYLWWKMRALAA